MFGLGPFEIVVIVVVAILVFGPRLPQVAAEFAGWMMKLKRSMNELRRESGIDREFSEVRRQVENAIPREVRNFDPARSVEAGVQALEREVAQPVLEEVKAARDALTEDRREPKGPRPPDPALTPEAEAPAAPPEATDPRHP